MSVSVDLFRSLDDVAPEAWNAIAGDDNPFVEHAFLSLLEKSESVGIAAGWVPFYLVVKDGAELVGATFAYLKDNSYGEYIFDWSWADASMRAGVPYYPKLTVAVPFTPATGPRFLIRDGEDKDSVRAVLLEALVRLCEETDASGLHFLYCTDDEARFLAEAGLLRRGTHQFHWRNDGYADYDGFLSALRSQPRKQMRRDARRVAEAGVDISFVRGDEVSDDDWSTLFALYRSTSARKWGSPYLTKAFFDGAKASVGHLARVGFGRRDGRIIAGTLSFEKGRHLYGRYWGAFERVDGLHFELCYHQHIAHAVKSGMSLVEAGAQGQHKVKRGYLPVITHSAHMFRFEPLSRAVDEMLTHERAALAREIEGWQAEGPFKTECLPDFPPVAGFDP